MYIRFLETTVTTQHVAEGIAVDYAEDGRIAGLEILDARARFGDPNVFRRVVLQNTALAAPAEPPSAPRLEGPEAEAPPFASLIPGPPSSVTSCNGASLGAARRKPSDET